jgi:hypothetical protein
VCPLALEVAGFNRPQNQQQNAEFKLGAANQSHSSP